MLRQYLSPYWMCQLLGWSCAAAYWVYWMVTMKDISLWNGVLNTILTITLSISATHFYALLVRRYSWHFLPLKQLVRIVFVAWVGLSLFFCGYSLTLNYFTYELVDGKTFYQFVSWKWVTVLMTGIRLMAIWLLAYHMYHYARRGAAAEAKATEAQLNQLKAQLNPHFLFNSLNTVKAMILDEPHKARRAVVLVSDILRHSLNVSQQAFVTLEEELQQVKDYLEIEQMRFEERLKVEYDIAPNTLQSNVLHLSLQTLVENATKHGISKRKAGGTVRIEARIEETKLLLTVINDGILEAKSRTGGIGLHNLKHRLQLQFGDAARLQIKQYDATRVVASISLPLVNSF